MSFKEMLSGRISLHETSYRRPNHVCLLHMANQNRRKGHYNDIIVRVGDQDFEACKMVLGSFSNYFHKQFTGELSEVKGNVLSITELDPESVKALIDYIYTEHLTLNSENVCSILAAAHYLEIAEAKLHCFHFLQEAISLSTYRDILTIGEQYNSTSLKDAAHEFIRVHSSEVLRDADFVTITKQEMVVYIRQRNRQVVTEENLFHQIVEWAKHDIENREKELPELLAHVDLHRMSVDFLDNVIYAEPMVYNNRACYDMYVSALRNRFQLARRVSRRNSEFLVFGGRGISNLVHSYDNTERLWRKRPDCITGRFNAVAAVVNNHAFLIGGQVQTSGTLAVANSIECLDLTEDYEKPSWRTLRSMKTKRFCCGCSVANDNVIVVGGADENAIFLQSCEEFDPSREQWLRMADMQHNRSGHAVVASHGCVYAVGGHDRRKTLNSAERFDWREGRWHHIPPMKTTRRWLSAAAANGDVYAIGGDVLGDKTAPTKTVEKFDWRMNCWTLVESMRERRRGCGACVLDNQIYVVGGMDTSKIHSTIEAYDLTTDQWQTEIDTTMELLYPPVASLQ